MLPVIPDLSVILAFSLAALVLSITPGPDMAYFISRTVNYGRTHGLVGLAGVAIGLVAHIALAGFGVSLLLFASPAAFLTLKIVGALYLAWLAIQALRSGSRLSLRPGRANAPGLERSFLGGVGVNLTNPKIILFFVTFLPQFVSPYDPDATGKILFLGLEFLVIGMGTNFVILLMAGAVANVLTRSQLAQRLLNWSFAGVFAGFAVAILATQGRH